MDEKMLCLLLGAGFSKWAADLPVASGLFDFAIDSFGAREECRLDRVRALKRAWDAMNPSGLAEQFIATVLGSADVRSREDITWYVARRLSEPFIWNEGWAWRLRRHVLMIDEDRKWTGPGVRAAAEFIIQFGIQLNGIITLNYDLLVEYALGTKGFNYGNIGEMLRGRGPYPLSVWRKPVVLTGRIPLAKLHGSISWDAEGKYTDGRRGLSGKALIVAPVPEKRPTPELEVHWILSSNLLGRSTRLVVFGFAFNEYDEALLTHLKNAGEHLLDVAIIDISSREDAAARLWPKARITSIQPPPQGLDQFRDWLTKAKRKP